MNNPNTQEWAPLSRTETRARDVAGTDTLWGIIKLFFRFLTPQLISAQILIAGALRVWLGEWSTGDLWVMGGILVYWPFQEWFFHLTLLHMKPFQVFGMQVDLGPARAHRYHHRHPWVLETTFVPPKAIGVLIPVNLAFWCLLMPTWQLACTGVMVFSGAALIYEWVHYLVHTPYKPKTRYFQRICRNHRLHHFKHERYWYSFTVPWIDTLFGTNPDPGKIEKSATVRTLIHLEPDDEFKN